jgi:hypothetical protein
LSEREAFRPQCASETLSDFIRARLRQLAHDKLPTRRILTVLRELAQAAAI